jgi:hypothetical protein
MSGQGATWIFFLSFSAEKHRAYCQRVVREIREYPLSKESHRAREFEEEVRRERRNGHKCECGGCGGEDFPWVSAAVAAYSILGDW